MPRKSTVVQHPLSGVVKYQQLAQKPLHVFPKPLLMNMLELSQQVLPSPAT
jgi:hypothetical protein